MKLSQLDIIAPDKGEEKPRLRTYDGKTVDIHRAAIEDSGGKTRGGEAINKPYVWLTDGTKLEASVAIVDLLARRFKALDDFVATIKDDKKALTEAGLPHPLPEDLNIWRFFTVTVKALERGVQIS